MIVKLSNEVYLLILPLLFSADEKAVGSVL